MKTHDQALAADLLKELAAQTKKGLALLFPKAKRKPSPLAVATAILKYVDAIHAGKVKLTKRTEEARALMLACAWGSAVCEELGYEWVDVIWTNGHAIGIVPPKRQFAIYPLPYMRRMLSDPSDNTILLLFNMLVAGNVPKAKANAYITFG